jgi:hypothetical protein
MAIIKNGAYGFNLAKSVEATAKEFWTIEQKITPASVLARMKAGLKEKEPKLTKENITLALDKLCCGELTAPLIKQGEEYIVVRYKLLAPFVEIKPPRKRRQSIQTLINKSKPKKKKPNLNREMDKETYHAVYGCFGVAEVIGKGGACVYNKPKANTVRRKVGSYIVAQKQKPNLKELRVWLRYHFQEVNAYMFTKQSTQIGIIHALQSTNYTGQEIYGLLNDVYGGITKGRTIEDAVLRENALNRRKSLAK